MNPIRFFFPKLLEYSTVVGMGRLKKKSADNHKLVPFILPLKTNENAHQDLSRRARSAVKMSALHSGFQCPQFIKGPSNEPLPSDGTYWSISHKKSYAGGVVSDNPVGFDIEEIRERKDGLFDRIAGNSEWEVFRERNTEAFIRMWSAKEAVLKLAGTGVRDLKLCILLGETAQGELRFQYNGREYLVEQVQFQNHVASITKNSGQKIHWHVVHSSGE